MNKFIVTDSNNPPMNVSPFSMQSYYPTAWTGKQMQPFFNEGNISPDQIQVNGIDLKVDKIFQQRGDPSLSEDKRYVDKGFLVEIEPEEWAGLGNKGWFLKPGYWIIEWTEKIRIPDHVIGLVFPRSTLVRIGGNIITAIWDGGYYGKGRSGLVLYNHILLAQRTRLAQMLFLDRKIGQGETYQGQYQNEGINDDQ